MADTPIEWPTDPFKAYLGSEAGEAWRSAMLRQSERFWDAQRKLLDEYETFSRALIERRRAATEATLETMRKLSACSDNAEWAKSCGEWFAGSVERVAADSRDILQESLKVFSGISESMSAAMSEAASGADAAKQAAQREAAVVRGAAIAQTAAAMQEAAARTGKAPPRFKKPEEGAPSSAGSAD